MVLRWLTFTGPDRVLRNGQGHRPPPGTAQRFACIASVACTAAPRSALVLVSRPALRVLPPLGRSRCRLESRRRRSSRASRRSSTTAFRSAPEPVGRPAYRLSIGLSPLPPGQAGPARRRRLRLGAAEAKRFHQCPWRLDRWHISQAVRAFTAPERAEFRRLVQPVWRTDIEAALHASRLSPYGASGPRSFTPSLAAAWATGGTLTPRGTPRSLSAGHRHEAPRRSRRRVTLSTAFR